MVLWFSLALADLPTVDDGEIVDPHCVDGQCIAWFEGPYMGGCMGLCCNMHLLWAGAEGERGRLLQTDPAGRSSSPPLSQGHPLSVRWVAVDEVEVVGTASLLPNDTPGLTPWTLSGLRAWGRFADRYQLEGDTLRWRSARWLHEGDAEVERALEAWIGDLVEGGAALSVEPGRDEQAWIDAVCPGRHDRVWARGEGRRSQLWVLGEGSEPGVTCVAHVDQDAGQATRLPGEGRLYLSEERACVGGIADGLRGERAGLACYDLAQPGLVAVMDFAGHAVTEADAYPLRFWEQGGVERLDQALAVELRFADQVVHGSERWAGPVDLAARWQAARVDEALLLRVQVTDDRVEPGKGPAADHIELDIWPGTTRSDAPPTRLAVVHDGAATSVRRWRWEGKEVDLASEGRATWTKTTRGYDVVLEIPRGSGLDVAGTYRLGVRVSDGDGGHQVVLASRSTVVWDAQWPPVAPEAP